MVLDSIKDIIIQTMDSRLDIDKDEITQDTAFISDLHCDSFDIAAIICEIEEQFDIEIDQDELEGIETVGDVAEKIEAMIE